MKHAFQCMRCPHAWRMDTVPIPYDPRATLSGWTWPITACPSCGSNYYRWLTHDRDPASVTLHGEEDPGA